jgi:hypothetical protein
MMTMNRKTITRAAALLLLIVTDHDVAFAFTPSSGSGSGVSSQKKNNNKVGSPSSPPKLSDITSETKKLSQALQPTRMSSTSTTSVPMITSEEDAHYILNKAREMAFSDDSDAEYESHYHPYRDEDAKLEEIRFLLKEMIYLQSGCVTGELMSKDICDNQVGAAAIVARLRNKIDRLERRIAKRSGYVMS